MTTLHETMEAIRAKRTTAEGLTALIEGLHKQIKTDLKKLSPAYRNKLDKLFAEATSSVDRLEHAIRENVELPTSVADRAASSAQATADAAPPTKLPPVS